MLSCTKMITVCLQSAKQNRLWLQQQQEQQEQQEQQPLHSTGQHPTIIHDIFRRADKNDDGKLSFEEFNAYFADGILTTDELKELFHAIDGQQNTNLDTEKLTDYFSRDLGEYLNVLSALENLNVAILKAMERTKKEYQHSSVLGQFVTRFMLRETSSQLLSLQTSLHCAMEALEEQACESARTKKGASQLSAAQRTAWQGACTGHHDLSVSLSDSGSGIVTSEVGKNCSQIKQLQQLLDKLEFQDPKLQISTTDKVTSTCTPQLNILLVQRQMSVTNDHLGNFQKVLKRYVDATSANSDSLHVSVQNLPSKACFMVYEFWQDRVSWLSHLQSNSSKDFQHCIINMLEEAELVSTMVLPASWWTN